MTEQTCDVGLSLSTGRDATQSHISSFCPVPRDTTLTILIGLLAMTLLLAGLVTLPDGAAPDSHTLSFLPNTKGMDGLHAQVRFVLATCAMLVLLMLLHVVSLRWRTAYPMVEITREMQRIAQSNPIPSGARAPASSDPILAGVSEAFNRLLVHIAQQASLLEKARNETSEYQHGFETVFARSLTPLCMIAADGSIADVNDAFCRLVGYSEDQLIEGLWMDLVVQENASQVPASPSGKFESASQSKSTVAKLKTQDGPSVRCAIESMVVRSSDGAIRYTIAHVTSIEHTCRLEEALESARHECQEATAVKNRVLEAVNSELRAPLGPASFLLGRLEREPALSADARSNLAAIRRHIETESRLLGELAGLLASHDGAICVKTAEIHIHDCLRTASEEIRDELAGKEVELGFDLIAEQDQLVGDRGRLTEAFAGIVRTVAAVTAQGASIQATTTNPTADSIRIDIAISKTAFDRSELARTFQLFAHQDSSLRNNMSKAGLDLAMACAVIEWHEGAMTAETDPVSSSAVIEVVLPVRATPDSQAQTAAETASAGEGSLRLLVVDEDRPLLRSLERAMIYHGHRPVIATTAVQAIACAESARFDLVICGTHLPDKTGGELMRVLHSRFGLRGIAISEGKGASEPPSNGEVGFVTHLSKPVRMGTLLEAIHRYAGGSSVHQRKLAQSVA